MAYGSKEKGLKPPGHASDFQRNPRRWITVHCPKRMVQALSDGSKTLARKDSKNVAEFFDFHTILMAGKRSSGSEEAEGEIEPRRSCF